MIFLTFSEFRACKSGMVANQVHFLKMQQQIKLNYHVIILNKLTELYTQQQTGLKRSNQAKVERMKQK